MKEGKGLEARKENGIQGGRISGRGREKGRKWKKKMGDK